MRARLAVATAAAAVLGSLVLSAPTPALASPDCDNQPNLPLCQQPEPELNHDPYGALTEVTRNRGIVTVRGYAADDDAPDATIQISVLVDGHQIVYAGAAPDFETTVVTSLVPGDHEVCADAANIGEGTGPVRLGCLTYNTPAPVGTPAMIMVPVSSSRIDVEWTTTDANAAGFRINHNFGGGWTEVTTLPADARTYAETGLAPDTPVCVQVVAFNDFSEQSNAQCTTTLHAPLPAFTEEETSVDGVTNHDATVHWVDSGSPATHYRVELFHDGQLATEAIVAATERSFHFQDLMEEADYSVRVSRYNPAYEVPADRGPATEVFRTSDGPQIVAASINLDSTECVFSDRATVSFTVRNAVRVTIRYGGYTAYSYGSADTQWSDDWPVFMSPDWTYIVTAYDPDGDANSVSVIVPKTPSGTIAASAVEITNFHSYVVRISLHEKDGWVPLGAVLPGQRVAFTLPRCAIGTITALNPLTGQHIYESTTVFFGDPGAQTEALTV